MRFVFYQFVILLIIRILFAHFIAVFCFCKIFGGENRGIFARQSFIRKEFDRRICSQQFRRIFSYNNFCSYEFINFFVRILFHRAWLINYPGKYFFKSAAILHCAVKPHKVLSSAGVPFDAALRSVRCDFKTSRNSSAVRVPVRSALLCASSALALLLAWRKLCSLHSIFFILFVE